MLKLIKQSGWLTGSFIFFMPILLILFLGSQMAYSQVRAKAEIYHNIPEITRLSQLAAVPPGTVVMLRGQISPVSPRRMFDPIDPDLVVYQERPAAGRETRYQEEFPLIFSEFVIDLPPGQIRIIPSDSRERVIQQELHTVPAGDRVRTGFKIGDVITVQGAWQPGAVPALIDATGITSVDKQTFMAGWQSAFQKIAWLRNGLGVFTLVSIILLVVQIRRSKSQEKAWTTQETTTIPTI